jgi:hypothetical protein
VPRSRAVRLSDEELEALDQACNGRPRGETVRVALLAWLSRQDDAKYRDQTPSQTQASPPQSVVNPYVRGTSAPGGKMPNPQVAPPEVALSAIAEARESLHHPSSASADTADVPNMMEEPPPLRSP